MERKRACRVRAPVNKRTHVPFQATVRGTPVRAAWPAIHRPRDVVSTAGLHVRFPEGPVYVIEDEFGRRQRVCYALVARRWRNKTRCGVHRQRLRAQ